MCETKLLVLCARAGVIRPTKQSRKSNGVFPVVPFRARGGVGHQSSVIGHRFFTDDY